MTTKELVIPKILNKNYFMKDYCPLNTQHLKLKKYIAYNQYKYLKPFKY